VKNMKLFLFVALVLVVAVAACGGDETSATQPATAEVGEAAQAGAGATDAQASEEDLSLASVTEGLAQATAYRSKLDTNFSGKDASGQAIETSWTIEEEYTVEPAAERVLFTSSKSTGGQPAKVDSVEIITIGESQYMITVDAAGVRTCVPQAAGDVTLSDQVISPDMWGSIDGARYAGTETVNGVSAKHYVWQESALTDRGNTAGKGETWVAVEGGYVVRQAVEASGKGLWLAETDAEGTTTWQWDVSDVNGSLQILPPEGCESAAEGLPVMADATDLSTRGDYASYASATAFEDVVAFYKAEMPKAGWQISGTPTERQRLALFDYSKDASTVPIAISWDPSAKKTVAMLDATRR